MGNGQEAMERASQRGGPRRAAEGGSGGVEGDAAGDEGGVEIVERFGRRRGGDFTTEITESHGGE
jgi:hypothetical protein